MLVIRALFFVLVFRNHLLGRFIIIVYYFLFFFIIYFYYFFILFLIHF
jgi:hypothetical protein